MTKPRATEVETRTSAFEGDVGVALSALQGALGAVLDSLPEHPRRAPELARQLGLERNLAWKLFRLIHERDVLAAARFVPGAASMEAFAAAAARAGVGGELLERVGVAAETYG